jgi:hypothetical protein
MPVMPLLQSSILALGQSVARPVCNCPAGPGGSAGKGQSGPPLPPGPKISKTNLRSCLESTKVSKNEPRTNLNEPEV